jgi:hypothetical protein
MSANLHDQFIERKRINETDQVCVTRLGKVHFKRTRSCSRAIADARELQHNDIKSLGGKLFLQVST